VRSRGLDATRPELTSFNVTQPDAARMYDFAPGMDHFAAHCEAMRLGALESMTAQVRTKLSQVRTPRRPAHPGQRPRPRVPGVNEIPPGSQITMTCAPKLTET
jgi:hypothetical protein